MSYKNKQKKKKLIGETKQKKLFYIFMMLRITSASWMKLYSNTKAEYMDQQHDIIIFGCILCEKE